MWNRHETRNWNEVSDLTRSKYWSETDYILSKCHQSETAKVEAIEFSEDELRDIEGKVFCDCQPNGDGFEMKVKQAVVKAVKEACLEALK